ncbi:NCE103 [Candida pseudojiufengensis]|uniref:NCE103 n=1 Tax=Candida pseudojiufengensis TaxID=497109 RepID=UPI002224124E|nr:NCE103 [Candida pseudojiufengensis]KAI5959630.1 NCE103 [Candida pseudojiufengensis]
MGRENILQYLQEQADSNFKDIEKELLSKSESTTPTEEEIKPNLKREVKQHSNFPFTLSPESTIQDYLNNNKFYIDSIKHNHNDQIFDLNSKGQSPHTLWIGCSDSRAGEQCLATLPGEIFVHRNIANIVNSNDISSQGVIQFAIDVLKVKKIIVCGHTDCGGIWASLSSKKIGGVLDLWLNPIRQIRAVNLKTLNQYNDQPKLKAKKLAELNIINSVIALKRHPSASSALKEGKIEVWGMIYDVSTGYLSEIEIPKDEFHDLFQISDEDDEQAHNPH